MSASPAQRSVGAWVLAAGPDAPGAEAVLERLGGLQARVLLTGEGLTWLARPGALERLRASQVDLALCSASADAGPERRRSAGGRAGQRATWIATSGRPFGWLAP
jgi:hypothetical protein